MASAENPMAYLIAFGLKKVEQERPEIASDSRYIELKGQLLQDAEGHFREIQATYATVLKTQCHCGGQLEPVDHDFGKSGGVIYDSVIARCRACGATQSFQFPKEGFISEARSAMALRDYLQHNYGIDYTVLAMNDLQRRSAVGA
ncbi:MAG TPA: hypothetical protein VE955_06325 [Candidatus Dormibacteraeota bacterium]|jgi:hypothetical protein|nr:hypothetical protein [Candidatus Dormibacteraeota bacterium]